MLVKDRSKLIAKSILYIAACLSLATIVSSCSTTDTTISEAPVVAANSGTELKEVVQDFMKSVESNDREKSRSCILEPDKSYNPEVLKQLNLEHPADLRPNRRLDASSSKGKSGGVGIPMRLDWFAVFREQHYEFGQIVDQRTDGEHSVVIVQLKDSRVGLAQNFSFRLKNEAGRWLIADIDWEGDPYLLNPLLPKAAKAQQV